MASWVGPKEPEFPRLTLLQSIRAGVRGLVLVSATIVLFPVYWLGLLLELAIPRLQLSTAVIWMWCRLGVWLSGLTLVIEGTPMRHGGARVGNHSSWLDIFTLRAAAQIFFVAKAEVARWPVIGFIARNTGTMFIARKRTEAKRQEAQFLERLHRGDRLCFFPEGTSSDGLRVLPFKSSLFNAFLTPAVRDEVWVQPMTAIYLPPKSLPANFYGWWGDMGFGAHMIQVFGRSSGGVVRVIFHKPVRARDFADRKSLSAYCEEKVRAPLDVAMAERGVTPPAGR